jgi:hypothetical protein
MRHTKVFAAGLLALALTACTGTPAPGPHGLATPTGEATGPDLYAEVASRTGLAQPAIEQAVTAAKVSMLRLGGREGEKLPGGIKNQAIVGEFAKSLGVAPDRAEAVLDIVLDEWEEYDQQHPGAADRFAAFMAKELTISVDRAAWLDGLLLHRPFADPDPVFDGVLKAFGITADRFRELESAWKSHP